VRRGEEKRAEQGRRGERVERKRERKRERKKE